jgi:hypothetical protein
MRLAPHSASYNRYARGSACASRRRARIRAIASKAISQAASRTNRSLAVSLIFRFHLDVIHLQAIPPAPPLARRGRLGTCPTVTTGRIAAAWTLFSSQPENGGGHAALTQSDREQSSYSAWRCP